MNFIRALVCVAFVLAATSSVATAYNSTAKIAPLGSYNVDKEQTTVSGLSSGAYMAVQMHIAHSSYIKGCAAFAGGPYHCAQGNVNTALGPCMQALTPPSLTSSISATDSRSADGSIDPIENIDSHDVYLFAGLQDNTVNPKVMNVLNEYYKHYVKSGSITYIDDFQAAHTQPTDDPANRNSCLTASSPYISYCDYDGAGHALQTLYKNTLQPRNDGTLSGSFIEWDQSEFIGSGQGMLRSGWMYVPKTCEDGAVCKLHVSFHGCLQSYETIGDKYVRNTGYNKWADANNIIVLYPQAASSSFAPQNPNGCWDWWGYNNARNYDTKQGAQVAAVHKAIDRISSGFSPLPAPTNLKSTGVTNSTIALSWNAVDGAHSYSVYRAGTFVGVSQNTSFTDKGLAPGTPYTYTVAARASSGSEGPVSEEVTITTAGDPPPLSPPTDVDVSGATASSLDVTWTVQAQAVSYNIFRDGASIGSSKTASYTDSGLQMETTYSYEVSAVASDGFESAKSPPVTGRTTNGWTCREFRDSNINQVSSGRARACPGKVTHACAVGSNDDLGGYNVLTISTVAETEEGYYVRGPCSPAF